ncbi:phosphatidate cytidylyltransferase [Candidatus Dependentiae bacterium]|nr:phosphatidate cytidylyltransferase [Candidatus Dependentiae bacterium]
MKLFSQEFFKRAATALVLGALIFLVFFYTPRVVFSILLATIWAYTGIIELPRLLSPASRLFLPVLILYLGLPLSFLILLNQGRYRLDLLILIILVAAFDTGSYIVGKLYGIHKIAPGVSPGKTWEGLFGGLGVCLISYLFVLYFVPELAIIRGFLGFFAISIGAFLGDLFESWLKRRAGVKDSGSILPGHGGVLDRIDGLIGASLAILFLRGLSF